MIQKKNKKKSKDRVPGSGFSLRVRSGMTAWVITYNAHKKKKKKPTQAVKPGKNSIFLKKGKTVISVENRKFSRSRMKKRIAPLNSYREI